MAIRCAANEQRNSAVKVVTSRSPYAERLMTVPAVAAVVTTARRIAMFLFVIGGVVGQTVAFIALATSDDATALRFITLARVIVLVAISAFVLIIRLYSIRRDDRSAT
jgi:hypothetical protein